MKPRVLPAAALVLLLASGAGIWWWIQSRPTAGTSPEPKENIAPTPGVPWLVDIAAEAGIDFKHFNSATPKHFIPETMGSGVGWIDYDADGWLDLFCVQSAPVLPKERVGKLPTCKLYRNQGDRTFRDVSAEVGLDVAGYGMGCAVGDYDNDGFDDLLVTFLDQTRLFHNTPGASGRRFRDVTTEAKIHAPHWPTSAAWGDFDNDSLLDLYICNYCKIDLDNYHLCVNKDIQDNYICPPSVFPTSPHQLYRNNGNGTFTDVSQASGIAAAPGAPGLAVATADLDGDGLLDIYVANDMKQAYLFHNQGGMKFEEKAIFSGCGLESGGRFLAGMGIAAGDFDDSGRLSLLVTNFHNEPNILFRNRGKLVFQDWSYPSGLGTPSIPRLAFGVILEDLNLDGRWDVAVANGHVVRNSQAIFKAPYAQESQIFVGEGQGKYRDVSDQAGPFFREKHVARGLAWADFDNDGKPDLAFSTNAGPLVLLHNQTPDAGRFVRVELIGKPPAGNRNAIGARLEAEVAGRKLVRIVHGGGSYLSASDRRAVFGLGQANTIDRLTIRWPSGHVQQLGPLEAGAGYRIVEGEAAEKMGS